MKKTIDQLNEQKQVTERKLRIIKNQIEDIENAQLLPWLIEKYECKYFKYQNSYSGSEKWWMYFYVSKVRSVRYVEGIEFQKTIDGEITVKKQKDMCMSLLETECTKDEFNKNIKRSER